MAQSLGKSVADTLISLVRQTMQSDKSVLAESLTVYTSFGVVRGRISRTMLQAESKGELAADALHIKTPEIIEVEDVMVEHYANHLAAAHYDRLFISTVDIRGFALLGPNSIY